MDGTQVCVFHKSNKVGFQSFLSCKNRRTLEMEVLLKVLGDLVDEALERKPADEEIGRLLIETNLTKSHRAGTVAMGLLDTADGGGGLAGSLCCKRLAWSFSSCGFACGLLGSCHGYVMLDDVVVCVVKALDDVGMLHDAATSCCCT